MSRVRSRRLLFALACCAAALLATAARAQEPEKVTLCQLKDHRADYNRKLIEVTAFVSHGFEDFGLFDPTCAPWPGNFWLEYGGTISSGTMYCCGVTGARTRPSELAVENIPIPLADDTEFRAFDELIQRPPDSVAHATIIGRFFAGGLTDDGQPAIGHGYGHMGCCSLIAIQQVISVDPQTSGDLDYRASTDAPKIENRAGCGVRDLRFGREAAELIQAQRQAEAGQPTFAFGDPDRVGTGSLAALLKIDPGEITHFKRLSESQGRVTYEWKSHGDTPNSYEVVVSRPYWLSFYAKDPKRVAWVLIAAYESSCDLANGKHRHFPL